MANCRTGQRSVRRLLDVTVCVCLVHLCMPAIEARAEPDTIVGFRRNAHCAHPFGFSGFQLAEENDALPFASGDQEYTQGIRVTQTVDPFWLECYVQAVQFIPTVSLTVGQNLYTPQILTTATPFPNDRGYSAFNYVGVEVNLTSASGGTRHTGELSVGFVGHTSLSRNAQGGLHALQLKRIPKGWEGIDTDFGLYTRYQLERRFSLRRDKATAPWLTADAVTTVPSVELGTVRLAAGAGAMFRIGHNLTGFPVGNIASAYPARTAMTTDEFRANFPREADARASAAPTESTGTDFEWAIQVGGYAKAVGHTRLVTGTSDNVEASRFVLDFPFGGYVRCGAWRASYMRVRRSGEHEVDGTRVDTHVFGTATLSYSPLTAEGPCRGPATAPPWLRASFRGWSAQLGMGTSVARRKFVRGENPTISSHLSLRRRVGWGLALGLEGSALALDEGSPSPDDLSTREMLIRQQLLTVGWGRRLGRAGSIDMRVGVPWLTKMHRQSYRHFVESGRVTLGREDTDQWRSSWRGGMLGAQYLLPLADRMTIGFDVGRHRLGRAPGPFANSPTWWTFATFAQLGDSHRRE